jgi:hypothetical protein
MRGATTTVCSCRMPPPRHSYPSSPLPSPSCERRIQILPTRPKDRRSMGSSARHHCTTTRSPTQPSQASRPSVFAYAALRVPSRHVFRRAHLCICSLADPVNLSIRPAPSTPWSPPGRKGEHPRSDDQGSSACRGSWSPSRPGPVMDAMDGCASAPGCRWPSGARSRPAARCAGRSVVSTGAARHRRVRAPQRDGPPRRRR